MYNILMESGIPMKLVRLIKMCLNETYSRVRVASNLYNMFSIKNGLEKGDALSPLLFKSALEDALRRVQVKQDGSKLHVHMSVWFMLMMLIYCTGESVNTVNKNTEAC